MYHPISLQVIRQALSWANIYPRNIVQRRYAEVENGVQTAIYSVYVELSGLTRYRDADCPHWGGVSALELKSDMRGCFMSDIVVASCWWEPGDTSIEIQIIVNLSPEQILSEGELAWLLD